MQSSAVERVRPHGGMTVHERSVSERQLATSFFIYPAVVHQKIQPATLESHTQVRSLCRQ